MQYIPTTGFTRLARIDGSGHVTDFELSALTVAAGKGQVWVVGLADRQGHLVPPVVGQIDPATGRLLQVAHLPGDPYGGLVQLAIGDRAVWYARDGALTRVSLSK